MTSSDASARLQWITSASSSVTQSGSSRSAISALVNFSSETGRAGIVDPLRRVALATICFDGAFRLLTVSTSTIARSSGLDNVGVAYCNILATMSKNIMKEMIDVIRVERKQRSDRLDDEDPNIAYDQRWMFDEPFINEMCLMVLVALRHQVERRLAFLAARVDVRPTITRKQYQQNVKDQRKHFKTRGKKQNGGKNVIATLNLNSFPAWNTSMKTLQLLSNCLKHEPTQAPDENLLDHLNLPLKPKGRHIIGYSSLPESRCFREGLAISIDLPKDADYGMIADTFIDLAEQFLKNVQQGTVLARVTGGVSLIEFVC